MKLIDDATSRTNRKHTSASKLIAFVDVRMSNCCQLCKNARPTRNAGLHGIVQGTAWLSISNRVGIGFGSQFDRPALESSLLRRTSGSPIIDDCIVLFWCIYARVLWGGVSVCFFAPKTIPVNTWIFTKKEMGPPRITPLSMKHFTHPGRSPSPF